MSRKKPSYPDRKSEDASDDTPASPLPEKFEVFAESMKAPAEPTKEETPVETGPVLPMEETTWSGLPMWRCKKCGATTFDRVEAETHTCKRTKWADEAEA